MPEFTDESWSSPEANLDAAAYCSVCLIDTNGDGPKIKANCKLPIRSTPGGPINKAALRNASSRIFQMTDVPAEAKKRAAVALVGHMKAAGMDVGAQTLMRLAGQKPK